MLAEAAGRSEVSVGMIISGSSSLKPLPNSGDIIIRFYSGEKVHPSGYLVEQVWKFTYEQLEKIHDYIQWIFPLATPSHHVQDVPVLTNDEIEHFRTDEALRAKVIRSLRLMLDFYGFEISGSAVVQCSNFREHTGWLYPKNHNYLRISRILESLLVLGFREESEAFLAALIAIYPDFRWDIGESLSIWKKILDAP